MDRDPDHLLMAAHNAGVYDVASGLTTRESDVRDVPLAGLAAVFADPARRRARTARGPARGAPKAQRLRPGDSEPPLDWCFALPGQVPAVVLKAAPGLPAGTAPDGWETEFVADGRDLKEAVLWSPALATVPARATILPAGDTLTPEPGAPVPVRAPGAFLFDPNPAVTRAGLVEDLARRLGGWKIDDRIAFLSTDTIRSTAFARTLQVVDSAPWNEKDFARPAAGPRDRLGRPAPPRPGRRRRPDPPPAQAVRPAPATLVLTGSPIAPGVYAPIRPALGLICTDPPAPPADRPPGSRLRHPRNVHKTSGLRDPAAAFPLPVQRDDAQDRREANRAVAVSAVGLAATGLVELLLAVADRLGRAAR